MKGLLQRVFNLGKQAAPPIDYEESKALVQSRDPADRKRVAADQQVKPEILYFLANDPDASVRTAVARNQATPVQADVILARDPQEAVRADLAAKISRFAPDLRPDETDKLKAMTYQVLETLIQDQAVRVRKVVAETLKDMNTAPVELIQRLARDPELAVAGPVLQYSPVLTDDDLLDIVRQLPIPGAAAAIAKRRISVPSLPTRSATAWMSTRSRRCSRMAAPRSARRLWTGWSSARRNTRPGIARWSSGRSCRAMRSRSWRNSSPRI
jgi:hypothetical protein